MKRIYEVFEFKKNDKIFLFDTGSPFSIRYDVDELSQNIEKLLPNLLKDLSKILIKHIDGLLGMDQIEGHLWIHDVKNQVIEKSGMISYFGSNYPYEKVHGIPVVKVMIDRKAYRFFLDTGSSRNYLKAKHLSHNLPLSIKDYSPVLGWFEVKGINESIEAFGHNQSSEIYVLPEAYESIMGDDVDGILGHQFLSNFTWVLDGKEKRIIVNEEDKNVLPVPFF